MHADTHTTVTDVKGEEDLSSPSSETSTSSNVPSNNCSSSSLNSTTISSTPVFTDNQHLLSTVHTQDQVPKIIKHRSDKPNKLSDCGKCQNVSKTVHTQTFEVITTPPLQKIPLSSTPGHRTATSPEMLHSPSAQCTDYSVQHPSLYRHSSMVQMPYSTHTLTKQQVVTQPADRVECLSLPRLAMLPMVPVSLGQGMSLKKTTTCHTMPVNNIPRPTSHSVRRKDDIKHSESPSTSEASIIKSLLSSNSGSLYNDNALLLLANCAVSVASTQNSSNGKSNESDQQCRRPLSAPQYIVSDSTQVNCAVGMNITPNFTCPSFHYATVSNTTTATVSSYSVHTIKVSNSRLGAGANRARKTNTGQVPKTQTVKNFSTSLHHNSGVVPTSTGSSELSRISNAADVNIISVKAGNQCINQSTATSPQITSSFKQFPKLVQSPFPLADIGEKEWHVIESTFTPKKEQSKSAKWPVAPTLGSTFNGQTSTPTASSPQEYQSNTFNTHPASQISPRLKCAANSQGNVRMFAGASSLTIEHPSYINDPDGAFSLLAKTTQQN